MTGMGCVPRLLGTGEQFVILKKFDMLGCPRVQVSRMLTGEHEKHRLRAVSIDSALAWGRLSHTEEDMQSQKSACE